MFLHIHPYSPHNQHCIPRRIRIFTVSDAVVLEKYAFRKAAYAYFSRTERCIQAAYAVSRVIRCIRCIRPNSPLPWGDRAGCIRLFTFFNSNFELFGCSCQVHAAAWLWQGPLGRGPGSGSLGVWAYAAYAAYHSRNTRMQPVCSLYAACMQPPFSRNTCMQPRGFARAH